MEHAYQHFFFQKMAGFIKQLSFANLIVSLPQILLLSFQLGQGFAEPSLCRASEAEPGTCSDEPLAKEGAAWSEEVRDTGRRVGAWATTLQVVQSVNCVLAVVSLLAIICRPRSLAQEAADAQVDLDTMLADAARDKEQKQQYDELELETRRATGG